MATPVRRGRCPGGLGQRRAEPHPCTPVKHRARCIEPQDAPGSSDRLPSTRRLAWILVLDPEALSPAEAAALAYVRQDAEVALLHELSRTYRRMVREKRPENLPGGWLSACTESGISPLQTFAQGAPARLRSCAVCTHSSRASSGQAEGQINRLKTIKRMMYGRAGFALLRKRVLYTAWPHKVRKTRKGGATPACYTA